MTSNGIELAERMGGIARSLLAEEDVSDTLRRIAEAAVELIEGCESAGIDVVERRIVRAVAPTDERAARLDEIQVDVDEGPCLDAMRNHEVYSTDDLAGEERWPNFARRAYEETGIRSIMGFRLYVEEDTMGALDLYSTRPHAFDDSTARIGSVLAAHAAVAWETARSRENLEEAMKTRDLIGQAKGILMERHRIGGDAAFERLVRMSQDHNVKLRKVAEAIVGEVESA